MQPSSQQQPSTPTTTQIDSPQQTSLPTPPSFANWSPDGRYYAVADGGNLAVVDTAQERIWQQHSATHFWNWTADSRFAIFSYAHPHGNRLTAVFDTAARGFLLETTGCDVLQGGSLIVFDHCGEAPVAISPVSSRFLMENGRLIELPGLKQTDLLADVDNATIAREGGLYSPALAAWSPDGQYLAFVTGQTGSAKQRYTLYLARGNGSQLRDVTPLSPFPRRLVWQKDGQTVTVTTGAGRESKRQYLVDAESGVVQNGFIEEQQ
jgi:dipeptidyl aminopeptidase/acylaminoacyl peptidase